MGQAMEKLVDQGLVKHIGVSNFSVKKMKDLLTYARIKPAVNQIEVHPYFRNDYNIDWCRSQARAAEAPACAEYDSHSAECLLSEQPLRAMPMAEVWSAQTEGCAVGTWQDIHVTAYAPLGSPDSATMMNRPHDTPSVMVRCRMLACSCAIPSAMVSRLSALSAPCKVAASGLPGAQQDETVGSVAEKLGKNPTAVLVRWAIQHGTSGAHPMSL